LEAGVFLLIEVAVEFLLNPIASLRAGIPGDFLEGKRLENQAGLSLHRSEGFEMGGFLSGTELVVTARALELESARFVANRLPGFGVGEAPLCAFSRVLASR